MAEAQHETQLEAQHWVATDFGDLDVLRFVATGVSAPDSGQVMIAVRAAGMNPADYKHFSREGDRSGLPVAIGYELAGVISAMGPHTEIASGNGAVGDEVIAFRVSGGYATSITVAAKDVFAKPESLPFPEAANLLLAGTTAAELLHVTKVTASDTVLVHGASGAVGVSLMQQAALIGARIIGTASAGSFETIERFGGTPVEYGDGLEQRVREIAPDGIDVALDTVGTDEAVQVSLALVGDLGRIATIAAFPAAQEHGFIAIGGAMPESAAFRDQVRSKLIGLAASAQLVVPMARTWPLADAVEALEFLKHGHPGGKIALIP